MNNKLPPTLLKPVVKRPLYDASLPEVNRVKRQSVIRGARSSRCFNCSTLLPMGEEICTVCGATQISPDSEHDGNLIREAPLWKKRYSAIGKPRGGLEVCL